MVWLSKGWTHTARACTSCLAPDLLPQSEVVGVLLHLLGVLVGLLVSERGVTEEEGEDNERDTEANTDD